MSCGVLIVSGDPIDQFLLMEHKNRLDLPKGHVDPGESEMECALRELEEETSIQAEDIELFEDFRFSHQYSVWPKRFKREECKKTLVVFLARLKNPVDIVCTEHQGYRWVDWDPPHEIQEKTIDPLLQELAEFIEH
jgi:8-oxo-dGTP pyrophosphatase MutT (NUDIX family)